MSAVIPPSPIPRTFALKSFTEPPCPQSQGGNMRQPPDIIMIPPEEGLVMTFHFEQGCVHVPHNLQIYAISNWESDFEIV